MADIFEKIKNNRGPLGKYAKEAHGYFAFPKLEGELNNKMTFRGKEVLQWSLNNYLGLGNHPEIRKVDEQASKDWGLAYPMGARMMSGNSNYHEQLEAELAEFEKKQDAILLNFGYQGMVSAIDALLDRNDVVVYDAESHACILDGLRLHQGKRFVYQHNDMESLDKMLEKATKITEKTNGAILVITEGVFGMSGNQGSLKDIVDLKQKYSFRLFVDDAHGFGTMGATGMGTGEAQGCQDGIDVYFGTFAKAMASIGGFIASDEDVIDYLRYNMRSQIYAKSLPMPLVIGNLKRLEMLKNSPEIREKLWTVANALQKGLKDNGFNLGTTTTQVTPVILSGDIPEATNLILDLRENYNLFCSIVVYPVVPKGVIMLRLIPTAMHNLEDVEYTINCFKAVQEKLSAGAYKSETIADIS
ncbi:aminotransferase class I/II-fold pyridoxal phosphate-dependent enzyme [Vicingus serpentipes]|jgi:glycine C-acetyltransferase|uniref:Aminotransferase class I/II-fold pyridoxal phosphate-dependent enzyme n=1 Tax=Vicingus serpentipes TaxID=1926625 RepID=A0A5C6RUN7_9FLAO|nr:aminotransferase class I/II-fold pyridoxal phosphate-dependent enzyme [Vicingus serpentipes]TXB66048.1 aminotransferase class I/II-fold pyridoxal phosphate-dependent enzyme [Vicingus serpentipes]